MPKYEDRQCSIGEAIADATLIAEELKDELQNWLDNLPEPLQGGEKANELEEAISNLEEMIYNLEVASSNDAVLGYSITYRAPQYPPSTYMSRAKRFEVGTAALYAVPTGMPEGAANPDLDEEAQAELEAEWDGLCEAVAEAIGYADSVAFPTR